MCALGICIIPFAFLLALFGIFRAGGATNGIQIERDPIDAAGDFFCWLGSFRRSRSTKALFEQNLFSMVAVLAASDGQVSTSELHRLDRLIANELKIDQPMRARILDTVKSAKTTPADFDHYIREMFEAFVKSPAHLRNAVEILVAIAMADGELHPKEEKLVRHAAAAFRISDARVDGLIRQRMKGTAPTPTAHSQEKSETQDEYELLECEPGDSLETIKTKYRAFAKEYHPDRLKAQGLPAEYASVATERFRKIHEAYQTVLQQHPKSESH